ncbi:MAG: SHOCT domain-containing protein [Acidimicrobiales bacterium]
MGLLRGMARTAVVAGTATAVSNRVSRRQAERWQQQEYAQQADYPQQQAAYAPPAPPPAPAPTAADTGGSDVTAELERLAGLRSQGVLTDDEFAAAKAKLLGL